LYIVEEPSVVVVGEPVIVSADVLAVAIRKITTPEPPEPPGFCPPPPPPPKLAVPFPPAPPLAPLPAFVPPVPALYID
jgi:hypothetical protein